ncbi:hypothetical protein [Buttiauxella gaviniae]|uniref:hypothetical protein n=1 Tax=Buttiauxella gaviniae TaxID=82990 RepID=UPI0039AEE905
MTSVNKLLLPPELDGDGQKQKEEKRNTSLRMYHYFTAIERMRKDENVSQENVQHFIKIHAIREATGGSYKKASEMYEAYKNYVEQTPADVRGLNIPPAIQDTILEVFNYVNWYYQMSFSSIETQKVSIIQNERDQFELECAELKGRLADCQLSLVNTQQQLTRVTEAENTLSAQLVELNELYSKAQQTNESLSRDLSEAIQAKHYLEQTIADLRQQNNERKQELNQQVETNQSLVKENKDLAGSLNDRKSELENVRREHDATAKSRDALQEVNNRLSGENSELHAKQQKLQSENERLEKELVTSASVQTEHSKLIVTLEASVTRLESQVEQSEVASSRLQADNVSLKGQLSTASIELEANNALLASSQTEVERMSKMIEQFKDDIRANAALLTAEKTISESLRQTISVLAQAKQQ